jgi:endonuclease YncB( thermonuclease family)
LRYLFPVLLLFCPLLGVADTVSGRVVRVTDGDTLVVLGSRNVQHKIRLMGIDAPERGQPYGKTSKQHLSERVAGKKVVVEYTKRDRYKRIVGKVLLSGKDMNLRQIEAGMAWHYKKYEKVQSVEDRERYAETEIRAREARRGLWREPNPVPPWEWRRR